MFWAFIWVKHFCKLTKHVCRWNLTGSWHVQLPIPVVCLHRQTGRVTFYACCVHTTMNARFRNREALHLPLSFEVVRRGGVWLGGGWRGLVVIGGTCMNLDEVRRSTHDAWKNYHLRYLEITWDCFVQEGHRKRKCTNERGFNDSHWHRRCEICCWLFESI